MIGLTVAQKRVLDFIEGFAAANDGRVPNYLRISHALGYAGKSAAAAIVLSLIGKGRLVAVRGTRCKPGYALPDVNIAGAGYRFVPMDWRRLSAGGLTLAYRGPYPFRGVTCADFGGDGVLHTRAQAAA